MILYPTRRRYLASCRRKAGIHFAWEAHLRHLWGTSGIFLLVLQFEHLLRKAFLQTYSKDD